MERARLTGNLARLVTRAQKEGYKLPDVKSSEPPFEVDGPNSVSAQVAPKLSKRGRKGEGRPQGGDRQLARTLGVSRDEIRRHKQIDSLSNDAKEKAQELGLTGNQDVLNGCPGRVQNLS